MANGEQAIIDVHPTVMLGLGGTGKEVLLRMRMKFAERYGVNGYPCISYLWVDTDIENQNVEREDLSPIIKKYLFLDQEKVDLRVWDPSKFLDNPNDFGWIAKWIPPAIVGQGLRMEYGAGQVRAKGRFALFNNFNNQQKSETIISKLRDAIKEVREALALTARFSDEKKLNLNLASKWGPQVNFFIVTSLAGGTGSGTFLDVAFLIRQLASEIGFKADITGILCLASLFTNDSRDRTFANCYAALKELEYYNFAPTIGMRYREGAEQKPSDEVHKFEDKWGSDYPGTAPLNGPPFDTCYLVDGYTYGGTPVPPERRNEVFDMIGDYLFWDFYRGEFANHKRTLRSNNRNFLDKNYLKRHKDGDTEFHIQTFSTSYSSFGLSSISVPLGSRIGACAYRLAYEMLEFWNNGSSATQDESQQALKSRNLVKELRELASGDDFALTAIQLVEKLSITTDGHKFSNVLTNSLEQYLQMVLGNGLRESIQKFEDEVLASKKGSKIYEEIGPSRNNLVQDYITGRNEKNGKLANWILGRLQEEGFVPLVGFPFKKPDGTDGRIDGYIDVLVKVILPDIRNEVRILKQGFAEKQAVASERKELFLNNFDELDTNFILYKNFSRRIILAKCKEIETSYAIALVSEWVCSVVLDIVDDIEKFLKQAKGELEAFQNDILKPTIGTFRTLSGHYAKEETRDLSISLYENLDEYYKLSENAVDVKQEKDHLFENKMPKGWAILRLGKDPLKEAVEAFAWKRFQDDFQERFALKKKDENLGNAVKLFEQKYPAKNPVNRSNAIKIFVGGGKPYVQPTFALEADVPDMVENIIIGMSNFSEESNGGLLRELKAGLQGVKELETEKEAILYYHEITGLPLFYFSSLGQYRQAYDHFQRQLGVLPLHTDKRSEKFPDIYLYPKDEARSLLKVWETIILGAILRVLQVEVSGQDLRYFYYKGRAAEQEVIGDERTTVKTILESFQNYDWCVKEIHRRKSEILQDANKIKIYAGILELYRKEIFYERVATLADGKPKPLPSFQSSVVNIFYKEVGDSELSKTLPNRNVGKESKDWKDFLEEAVENANVIQRKSNGVSEVLRYVIKDLEPFVLR